MRLPPHPAFLILVSALILLASWSLPVEAQDPTVHAVLLYSPACPHCRKLISEDLVLLAEKYGEQLQIAGVDTTQPEGHALYQDAVERFSIPDERRCVPTLIIGDIVLVGSLEIPQQLPGQVEKYLAQGDLDWPDIPGLAEALAATKPTPTATIAQPTTTASSAQLELTITSAQSTPTATFLQTSPTTAQTTPSLSPAAIKAAPTATPARTILKVTEGRPPDWRANLARDPAGNALAIVVLIGMVLVVGYVLVTWPNTASEPAAWRSWAIPLLSLFGLGVAGYLAYVETQQVAAVCGPVGDCNTVQQSAYTRLLGLIPVGVLGVAAIWRFCSHGLRGGSDMDN